MFRELKLLHFVIVQCLFVNLQTSRASILIVEERNSDGCKPCYRKLFTGKRLAEVHVRRAMDCEHIDECGRECDSEKGFACEGFNYRHPGSRGSVRGRNGLCELTAVPPSQIDVARDILHEPRYDYYERETGCHGGRPLPSRPSSPYPHQSGWTNVRPFVHDQDHFERPAASVYPHGRPIEIPRPLQPIDIPRPLIGNGARPPSNDYNLGRRPQNRFQGEPPPPSPWRPREPDYPPRRLPNINIRPIEDDVRFEYFAPGSRPPIHHHHHQIGSNEIDLHYQPGRRKDHHPEGYGNVYGSSYGYNTNYIDAYEAPKRGEPYDNGVAVYGDHRREHGDEHCSVRSGGGFKLRRGIVRKSYLTPTLDQCEKLCAVEKDCICMTFSYRYNLAANAPTDNCLLSEIPYRDLDFYTDLEPDRDYDIYSMTGNSRSCDKEESPNQRPPEECFWRVRSGCGVPPEVVRKTLFAQGLGDCEAECVGSRLFTCRSFVYRYVEHPNNEGSPNCLLSDWPSQEIDPLALPDLDGAELYQRGSFGRGCEPSPFPPLNYRRKRPEHDKIIPPRKDEVCYAEYQKPCRLTPQAVMVTIYVESEFECRQRCSEMRDRDAVPCMSFSYRISSEREDHNCFMSDVPRRDLRPGIDYVHGDGHLLFAWKEFEPHCDSASYSLGIFFEEDDRDFPPNKPAGGYDHQRPGERPDFYFEPPYGGEPRPGRPDGGRYPTSFEDHRPGGRPSSHVGEGHLYPSGRPINPDRPDPVNPNYEPSGSYYPDNDGRFGHDYSDDRYETSQRLGASTFQHFTVNGRPCKRGTRCERNKVAGFWSCEPEGGEYGAWDYCCEPKHHCGYSQGYHYPWCYVGPQEDQWRPCSERYYPYLQSSRPVRPGRPSTDRFDEHDNSYGEVPRPGLLGRHWPVAYLHREAPPNATDSIASAADTRRDRELNTSIQSESRGSRSFAKSDESSQARGNRNAAIHLTSNGTGDGVKIHTRNDNRPTAKIERVTRLTASGSNEPRRTRPGKSGDPKEVLDVDVVDLDGTGSPWSSTTFVKLPTISPNTGKDRNSTTFDDYFEVVNVK